MSVLRLLGLLACAQPAPEDSGPACPDGQVLDHEGCVPEVCGTGRWGETVADDAVYVDPGAASGGDGTKADPLTRVQDGADLAASRGGGSVLLARGRYTENVRLGEEHDGVAITGRCRELVTLDGSDGTAAPTLAVSGGGPSLAVALAGVTLQGGTSSGLWVEAATVSLGRSDVVENRGGGVVALDSADVTLEDVDIVGNTRDSEGNYGYGVDAESGARVTLTRGTVAGNAGLGVFASQAGTSVQLSDSAVSGTLGDGTNGYGVTVQGGADLVGADCTVDANTGIGVSVSGVGSSATLSRVEILDTLPGSDGLLGHGLDVDDGADVVATGCSVLRSAEVGVRVSGAGTSVTLEDTTVADTVARPDGTYGNGVTVQDAASFTATRCAFERNGSVALFAQGAGVSVWLEDSALADTLPSPDGSAGYGLELRDGATLTASSCTFDGNVELGALVSDDGTVAELTDCTVANTASRPDGLGGRGVEVGYGATLMADGCVFEANREVGLLASEEGATVELTGCSVIGTGRSRDTGFATGIVAQSAASVDADSLEVSGTDGPGLYVTDGASIRCDGCVLAANAFAGALATNGTLGLSSASITDTAPDSEYGGGFGLYATALIGAPTVTLTDSTIGEHPYAAVWLDGGGLYDIERNALSGGPGVDREGHTLHGNAVFAENGVSAWSGDSGSDSGLLLLGNEFSGASVAVLLDGASATLSGNTWTSNGTDVWQQRCSGTTVLTEADLEGVPLSDICPPQNLLTAYDLVFSTLYLPEVQTEE